MTTRDDYAASLRRRWENAPPPEDTTEPREHSCDNCDGIGPDTCMFGPREYVERDETCGYCGRLHSDFSACGKDDRPSSLAPAAEVAAVLDRKPVRNHPDTEARNVLAGFVMDRMHPWVQGGYVAFSARHGIAGDFLHWLDEHRPGWRDDAAEVSALRAEVERSERDWKQASEDADRWCARAEAAEAEVKRLTDLLHTVTNDATARDARREVAEQQLADLRAGIESVQKAIENNRGIDRAWDALNALLAGSGEQPGEGHEPDLSDGVPDDDGKALPAGLCYRCQRPAEAHRPAPVVPDSTTERQVQYADGEWSREVEVVPDSTGLRERVWRALADAVVDSEPINAYASRPLTFGESASETLLDDLTDAVLAAVRSGEQDCNCGFGGQHDPANPRCRVNDPSEAWLRSGEQGGDRG